MKNKQLIGKWKHPELIAIGLILIFTYIPFIILIGLIALSILGKYSIIPMIFMITSTWIIIGIIEINLIRYDNIKK